MAKSNNSGRTKKSHNYKPYDTSNSFVKRITAKVSEILPQPSSWVSRLFSPAPKLNVREHQDLEDDEEEEEERQPPSKRPCFGHNEASDYSHQNNINRFSDQDRESGDISPILSSQLDDDRARPGPSGLHLRKFVSSTPAVRPQATLDSSPRSAPSLMTKTSVSDLKKTVRRSSLNLSSSSTLNSSTQPSFDTFVFKNPLHKRPRTSLNESCFYPGETTYGGASARVSLPIEQPKARVVNVTASPSLQRDTIGTSALRILKALEQFSTPVLDAKKIPVRTEGSNPRKRKPPQPYEELIFPTMPELLSLKRREVVNKPFGATEVEAQKPTSTEPSVITSTTAADLPVPPVSNTNSYPPSTSVAEYSIRPESSKEATIGSIKRRQKDEDLESERVPELNLPNVHLKLTSLPKFDLGTPASGLKTLPSKNSKPKNNPETPKFIFSEPEVLYSPPTGKTVSGFHTNNFKFSEPLDSLNLNEKTPSNTPNLIQKTPSDSSRSQSKETSSLKMKLPSPNFKLKRKSVESSPTPSPGHVGGFKLEMPFEMKTGSIVDVFSKNQKTDLQINSSETSLNCSKCKKNINKSKGKCSCENSTESNKLLDKKMGTNKFQLKNDNSEINKQLNNSDRISEQAKSPLKSFEGYKKPVDTWECKECFVNNKNSCDTCVACSSPKDGKASAVNTSVTAPSFKFSAENKSSPATSFVPLVNSVKKPKGTWECNTCLVQNKEDATSCAACTTPKPGLEVAEKPKPTFSFVIPASSETKNVQCGIDTTTQKKDPVNEKPNQFSFGCNDDKKGPIFKFGNENNNETVTKTSVAFPPMSNSFQKSDKWECSTCLVQNKKDIDNCVACNAARPGSNAVEKPKPAFSFGIPNSSISPVNNVHFSSNLNSQKSENSSDQPHFTFGNKPDEKKPTTTTSSSLFKFGSSETKSNIENKPSFNFNNSEKPKENEIPKLGSSNLFTFGKNNTSDENKIDESNLKDGVPQKKKVSFGKPLVSEKSISNDSRYVFNSAVTSKSNDVGSSNFTFSASSPFQNNSTTLKESTKEPVINAFTFGKTDSNANLKPLSEPTKPLSFNSAPTEMAKLSNNEHPNTHNIFGGSFTGFKPAESENKPFSLMSNSQGGQGGQFTFNSAPGGPGEMFGNQQQQASSVAPLFGQQQPSSAPSLFSQPSENKPFVFGAPTQPPQQQSVFTFSGGPQQNAAIGGSVPPFGGFTSSVNPTPVFDPNVKPSFNFTGGATPSFSAPAIPNSSADQDKRKVRKAIRRSTQHR